MFYYLVSPSRQEVIAGSLPDIRTSLPDIGHDLLGILGNLIPILIGNRHGIKQRRHQPDARRPILQIFPRVVQRHPTRRIDAQKRQRRRHGLHPRRSPRHSRKQLLKRRPGPVSRHQFRRRLAARHAHDIPLGAPFDYVRKHDRRDDEFGPGVDGPLGVLGVHDGAAADHDVPIVLLAKIGEVVEAVGRGERELDDFESAVDAGLHGFGAGGRGGGAEDGAGADGGEGGEDAVVVGEVLGAVQAGGGEGAERGLRRGFGGADDCAVG
mmetsp:Transcript_5284/g.10894  ORF Transcript_5284/g.10894 Transcript_5284/m.10894 type:complete len:267 (-) Transcript_5284:172-972(-)